MENNTGISTNTILINDSLNRAKAVLQDLVLFSMEEIKDNPASEEEILSLWSDSMVGLSNFFFQECERINNKRLYKRIIRSLMFRH